MYLLPAEILQEIGSYLDKDDILNCSLVCRFWRNSLNINKIWSNFCFKDYLINPKNISILDQSKSCVYPKFESPNNECISRLSNVCLSRVRYMQEVHISRNWKYNKFICEVVTEDEEQDLERMESQDLLYDNDILIVYFYTKRLFRVWELGTPTTARNSIICSLRDSYVKYYKLCEGVLVFVQLNLLQVYTRQNDNNFRLKYRLLITESLNDSNSMPDSPDITSWYQQNQKDEQFLTFDHNGRYFIASVLYDSNKAIFHIWDITKREKTIKSYTINGKSIIKIITEFLNDTLFIQLNFRETIQILSYDFNSQNFTNLQLSLTCNNYVTFTENLIISLNRTICMTNALLCYSLDGKFIKSISCDYRHSVKYSYPYIILYSRSKACKVQIIDTNKFKTVGEFFVNKEIDSLDVIRPNMVLVRILKQESYTELWNFINCCKLHTFFYPADCIVNTSRTKMVVLDRRSKILALNFW